MNKLFYFIALIFFPIQLNYSQSHELSLQKLCSLSDDIVIAKPISYNSFQSENKKYIYTKIKFKVIDNIKGRFSKTDEFEMTVYGGKLNGMTQMAIDAPIYVINEESLLFLSEKKNKAPYKIFLTVTGGIQGKYNIYADKKDGIKKLIREQSDSMFSSEESTLNDQNKLVDQPRLDAMINSIKAEIGSR